MNFVTTLTSWLEPYHNHTRPPPAAVLAEATKHNNPKLLRGTEFPPQNGNGTNGHAKKVEEAPPITDAPEGVPKFFDGKCPRSVHISGRFSRVPLDMSARFESLVKNGRLPSEILHAVTLTQEVVAVYVLIYNSTNKRNLRHFCCST